MSKRDRQARERARQIVAAQKRAQERRRRMLIAGGAVALVLALFAVLIVVKVSGGGATKTAAPSVSGSAAAAVTTAISSVPADLLDKVGAGKVDSLPKVITGQPALTDGGKPLIFYYGAEYCPFCAAQRWAVVVALSRFGTFSGLGVTHSASDDTYPNTPTLSFHGATYKSDYLSFQGVETTTNVRQGNGYAPLDQPTQAQTALVTKYDAAPYVDGDSAGSIPFMDFANKAVSAGAAYSPALLAGLTPQQVIDALNDPTSDVAQAIGGAANAFTALLCQITANQPANVCTSAGVKAYAGKFDGAAAQ